MLRLFFAFASVFLLVACNSSDPPRTPEELCTRACADKVKQCSSDGCANGCNLSLDRLVEQQTEHVIACMSEQKACDDATWSRCNVRIGVHADGGPPPPPPPEE